MIYKLGGKTVTKKQYQDRFVGKTTYAPSRSGGSVLGGYGGWDEPKKKKKKKKTTPLVPAEQAQHIPDFIPAGTPTTTDPATGLQVPTTPITPTPTTPTPTTAPTPQVTQDPAQMSMKDTPFGRAMDTTFAIFSQPIKSIAAAIDPNITVQETVQEFYSKPVSQQIGKILLAGAGYGSAILTLGGLFGGAAAGTAVGTKASTAVITRTATIGKKTMTTQRAFQTLGGSNYANISKAFQNVISLNPAQIGKFLSSKAFKKIGAGAVALSSIDALGAWLASDNIMQGTSMYAKELVWAVRNRAVSKEDALSQLEELQNFKDNGESFVKISAKINPILWPLGKILMTNAKASQMNLDLAKTNIIMTDYDF